MLLYCYNRYVFVSLSENADAYRCRWITNAGAVDACLPLASLAFKREGQ